MQQGLGLYGGTIKLNEKHTFESMQELIRKNSVLIEDLVALARKHNYYNHEIDQNLDKEMASKLDGALNKKDKLLETMKKMKDKQQELQ